MGVMGRAEQGTDMGGRSARVREEIDAAARRVGRGPDELTLVGVCKTVERPVIDEAYRHGLRHFGENRVQVAREKFGAGRPADLTLHLIGSLQPTRPGTRSASSMSSIPSTGRAWSRRW